MTAGGNQSLHKNPQSFFVCDLHGRPDRYRKLVERIDDERPMAVFMGGDLLPAVAMPATEVAEHGGFVHQVLAAAFKQLQLRLGADYPRVFLILGNDDPRVHETAVQEAGAGGTWEYVHARRVEWTPWSVYGYAFVPPTPFRLKDWERYDVSRYVDPGCIHPQDGVLTRPVAESELGFFTIQQGLAALTQNDPLDNAVCLFHAPPYRTGLDRAALDGRKIDHVPLDVHVGSMAIRRFIEERQPRLTLHGHVHESARLTGIWREILGRTVMLSAAHDGGELCLVRFDPRHPEAATRELI